MGEYARRKSDGERVKIGTCEEMFYLRWDDVGKVSQVPNSLDPATTAGLFFRLPFPDEDQMQPGDYTDHTRGYRLGWQEDDGTARGSYWNDWTPEGIAEMKPGLIQLSHKSGLLLNVQCHHGAKLPDTGPDVKAHWNGKSHSFELIHVKHVGGGVLRPVYHCRHCGAMWSMDWAEILPFCGLNAEMLRRLEDYAATATGND